VNIAVKCKRFDEVQSAAPGNASVAYAFAVDAQLRDLRNDILADMKERMCQLELQADDTLLVATADLAYFNTWLNLRGGWKL
jgi:hypothetical protein